MQYTNTKYVWHGIQQNVFIFTFKVPYFLRRQKMKKRVMEE